MRNVGMLLVIALLAGGVALVALMAPSGGGTGVPVKPRETETSLRARLKQNPSDADANLKLANLLANAGEGDQAVEFYQAAIAGAPGDAAAPYGLAMLLAEQGKTLESQKLLEKNWKMHPDDPATNEALADMVAKSMGEMAYPTVKPYYEKALAREPGRARAALGLAKIDAFDQDFVGAGAILQKAVTANPRNVDLQLALARNLAKVRDFTQAAKHFDIATALKPDNADAWADWGLMLIDAGGADGAGGNAEEAESKIRKALDLAPKSAAFHVDLGMALREQHLPKEALEQFKIALDEDAAYGRAYYEAGITWAGLHDEGRAEQSFRAAMTLDSHDTMAKVMLARLLVTTDDPARRNYVEAMDLFGQAVAETHEQDLSVLVAYAHALGRVASVKEEFRAEFYQRAIETVDKAIALGKKMNIPPETSELLWQYRMSYLTAQVPPVEHGSPLGFDGYVRSSLDDPIVQPDQPPVEHLVAVPLDLSQRPSENDALSRALRPDPKAAGGAGVTGVLGGAGLPLLLQQGPSR